MAATAALIVSEAAVERIVLAHVNHQRCSGLSARAIGAGPTVRHAPTSRLSKEAAVVFPLVAQDVQVQ